MKKLLFIALFTIGLFSFSNAQMLYNIENQSPYDVEFKMGDSGGVNGVYFPLITANGGTQGGVFGSPLVFPLQFGANFIPLNCSAFQSVAFSPSSGSTPFVCFVAANMGYTLQTFGFFYVLNVEIS